jgi:hypothetical protein
MADFEAKFKSAITSASADAMNSSTPEKHRAIIQKLVEDLQKDKSNFDDPASFPYLKAPFKELVAWLKHNERASREEVYEQFLTFFLTVSTPRG